MKKLFLIIIPLALSVGLWALDNVPYVDVEISTDARGHEIMTHVTKFANNVKEITDASDMLNAGWYVVTGANVQTGTLVCNGAVHIILADGAQLTATGISDEEEFKNSTPGIKVSGADNSLAIYGQTAQTGQLMAIGGDKSAGIGGGWKGSASNIFINGGSVFANTNNTYATAIGAGPKAENAASNIYISDAYILKLNGEKVAHSSAIDMAKSLNHYISVSVDGLATPYTRAVKEGHWGTICLPYAATSFSGAEFYKVNYYDGVKGYLYLEPVETLMAGMPYIFKATAAMLTINHNATTPMAYGEAGVENDLYGSFVRMVIAYDSEHQYAAISGDEVRIIESGYNLTIPACRTYLDMNKVPTSEQPHSAPLRAIGAPRQTPTGMDNVNANDNVNKFIIDGQVFIKKGNVLYNAQGAIINANENHTPHTIRHTPITR